MRLTIVLLVFLCAFSFGDKVLASKVDKKVIREVANNFIRQQFSDRGSYIVDEIEPIQEQEETVLFVVNLKPEGWILFSASDGTDPVLGFSYESTFDLNYDKSTPLAYWIGGYINQIDELEKEKGPRNPNWDKLILAKFDTKSAALTDTIAPLIKVKWDQGEGWNQNCPFDLEGPGNKTYVGCVGVAVAQAMSVYSYPKKGMGSVSYNSDYGYIFVNYGAVKDYSWGKMSLDTPDEYNARILYHAAASVKMNFGIDGSGTLTSYAPYAMKNYFKYASSVEYVERYSDDTSWKQLLMDELSKGRPIIYSGYPASGGNGHAFNIDGVASNGFFHLNWGWSGRYNGYFHINALKPGTNDFTKSQGAVIGIEPPSSVPTGLVLSDTVVEEKKPVGSVVAAIDVVSGRDNYQYDYTVYGRELGDGTYEEAEFFVENDTLKSLKVFNYGEDAREVTILVSDTLGNSYSEKFNIAVAPLTAVDAKQELGKDFSVYPNPFDDYLIIRRTGISNGIFVSIYDVKGVKIFENELDSDILTVNTDKLKHGVYILKLGNFKKGTVLTQKLIK